MAVLMEFSGFSFFNEKELEGLYWMTYKTPSSSKFYFKNCLVSNLLNTDFKKYYFPRYKGSVKSRVSRANFPGSESWLHLLIAV